MQTFSIHQRLSAVSALCVKLWLYWSAFQSDHVSSTYKLPSEAVVMVDLRTGEVQQNIPNVGFQLQPSFRNHWVPAALLGAKESE